MTYDVSTADDDGKRRLRRVAKVCEGFGQRVQKSVFECVLTLEELEILIHRLTSVIELDVDSLRIYRLLEPRDRFVRMIGRTPEFDIRDPLVI